MIWINSHPNMSTAFSPGCKATNQKNKICMAWPFWAVMLQFHLYAVCIYVILFVL